MARPVQARRKSTCAHSLYSVLVSPVGESRNLKGGNKRGEVQSGLWVEILCVAVYSLTAVCGSKCVAVCSFRAVRGSRFCVLQYIGSEWFVDRHSSRFPY